MSTQPIDEPTGRAAQVAAEAREFYESLVAHGLIVPTEVPGAFARGPGFERVLCAFDALVQRETAHDGAESLVFPPVIDRRILERVDYLDSFPDLCGVLYSFEGDDRQARELSGRIHRGEPWADRLAMTEVALNPAACYPLYPTMRGTLPPGGRLVTMFNWVFRHESSPRATRMQAFRVREFVRAGQVDEVLAWRDEWVQRGQALLESLELPAQPEVAADPFFGRAGRMLASNQKELKLKYELLLPADSALEPTAVCSFNFHQQHFGSTYGIRTSEGASASSACLGFGLERVTMALFRAHGFDSERWPRPVRHRLWP